MAGDEPKGSGHFTLFELLVVLACLAGVGSVALSRSRLAKERAKITENESLAIASLKTIVIAEEQYRAASASPMLGQDVRGYASQNALSRFFSGNRGSMLGRHLDWLENGRHAGYSFALTLGTPSDSNYAVQANPLESGRTGVRCFFVDSSGVIRWNTGRAACSADSAPD